MNKRITSIVLSLVMLFTMLATAVPVFAATPVALKVTADTTSANPGDTINYKVSVGAVTNMGGLEFRLNIPSGLTIVDGSISIPTGLETTIDSDGAIVVPKSGNGYKWSYSAQMTGYTGSSDLVILNFACTVDDGASGDKIVTINVDTFFDNDHPYPELDYTVTPATVNVTAAPVAVTGVTIDETLSVNIGQTKTPSFTVAPAEATNKTVSFTSDNPAVATVNATTGEVTGVKKGTATITVKTADGNFTDTCTVTVSCAHTESGWKSDADGHWKECTVCGAITTAKAAHTPGAAATETTPQKCTECDYIITPALGHTHSYSTDWETDTDKHWHECSCGAKSEEAAHTASDWIIDTAATATTDGTKHKECTVCHRVLETGTIPATGYTITFDANGGTGTMTNETGVSGEYTLPANGFTAPAGKQFKAWSVGGVEKAAGDKITVTANTTVTAVWENIPVVTYTVSFAANGGTGTMADVTGVSGEYTLPANGFTAPSGKQFKAWSVGGVEKAVGDKITVTANTTVTAVWEDIPVVTYTVTFDANGGSVTPASAETTAEGKLTSLPTPTRSRYSFEGWYTAASGGTKITTDTVFSENTTVYAQWTYTGGGGGGGRLTRYTVTFESNGGSKVSSREVYKNDTVSEPTAPTKAGYAFGGWYTDKALTEKYDFSTKVRSNFKLYAKWTEQDNTANQIILTIDQKDAMVFGKKVTNDVAPKIVNDRTMLPARFVAENLGATVFWDGDQSLVTIIGKNEKDETVTISFVIGASVATVNGVEVKFDTPAFIENNRTYTPIRFISERLGAKVDWIAAERKAVITRATPAEQK